MLLSIKFYSGVFNWLYTCFTAKNEQFMDSDNLPVGEVGEWALEKHAYVERYIEISRKTRAKYLQPLGTGGATYTDLFCGAGRSRIKNTDIIVDGSAIVAWKASVKSNAPFSRVFVCDADKDNLEACVTRLEQLGAPVEGVVLGAKDAAPRIVASILSRYRYGLHFAFLDPFNLEALDFSMIEEFNQLDKIDLLIHVSAMDLQRNLQVNLDAEFSAFDKFAPGWRESVDKMGTQLVVRQRVIEFWREKVSKLDVRPSNTHKLISGERNQPLYWLILAAGHELAHKFWETASNPEGQGSFGF